MDNCLFNTLTNFDGGWHLARYGQSKSGGNLYSVWLVVVPPKLNLTYLLSVFLSRRKICIKMSWYNLLDIKKL